MDQIPEEEICALDFPAQDEAQIPEEIVQHDNDSDLMEDAQIPEEIIRHFDDSDLDLDPAACCLVEADASPAQANSPQISPITQQKDGQLMCEAASVDRGVGGHYDECPWGRDLRWREEAAVPEHDHEASGVCVCVCVCVWIFSPLFECPLGLLRDWGVIYPSRRRP
jgi:hypothetical protein